MKPKILQKYNFICSKQIRNFLKQRRKFSLLSAKVDRHMGKSRKTRLQNWYDDPQMLANPDNMK